MKINPINVPIEDFKNHLDKPENERILFSGKFGIGKTWFLDEFFKKKDDKYIKIHLYPVNYSVAVNKDIFELIKVDILLEVLRQNLVKFEDYNFSKSLIFQFFFYDKLKRIFPGILNKSIEIGKFVEGIDQEENINILLGLAKIFEKIPSKEKFELFKKEIQEDQDLKTINDFFESLADEKGNLYEHNIISRLLIELINKIDEDKESGQKRDVVLVIDDLDRIDPEHIFRILNVFSAHFDINKKGNKFGFDKVVFVCDVKNLKSIFHHKYGLNTDFDGYLDKFYSNEVYRYDNSHNILNITTFVVESYKLYKLREQKYISFTKNFIDESIKGGDLSLRTLLQEKALVFSTGKIKEYRGCDFRKGNFFIIDTINFLSIVFNGIDNLISIIENKISRNYESTLYFNQACVEDLLPLAELDLTSNYLTRKKSGTVQESLKAEYKGYSVIFNLEGDLSDLIVATSIVVRDNFNSDVIEKINYLPILLKACRKAKELGLAQ